MLDTNKTDYDLYCQKRVSFFPKIVSATVFLLLTEVHTG